MPPPATPSAARTSPTRVCLPAKCILLGVLLGLAGQSRAALVGQWHFENGSLADSTGHFANLVLRGNATVSNGALDLNGAGTTATGWAATTGAGGLALASKTLVSWITLQGLQNLAKDGSAMTLDSTTSDKFDGIIFAERSANRWMSGSSNYSRSATSGDFNQPAALETAAPSPGIVQLAITYQDLGGGNVQISGYRNGILMGTYTSANLATWAAGEQEVIFGMRHLTAATSGYGALDALIHEARLYDTALTQAQLQGLTMVTLPPPITVNVPAGYSGADIIAELGGGNPGNHLNLLGSATFGAATGCLFGNIMINAPAATLSLATGGNTTMLLGALSGTGALTLTGGGASADCTLGGAAANTLSGTHRITQGTLALGKPAATTAIAGNLVLGGGISPAALRWDAADQIADTARMTLQGPQLVSLNSNGFAETLGPLELLGNAELRLGSGAAQLRFGASAAEAWRGGVSLVIREWDGAADGAGSERVVFGNSAAGLTPTQLAQVSFVSPAGYYSGTYPAKILASGELVPDGTPLDYPYETPARPASVPPNWLTYHLAHPGPGSAMPGDPNCALFWNGRYHLHYIYTYLDGFSFAHVSSADMVHWQWHPTTLTPPKTGHGMYSGTGFLTTQGQPAIIYHGEGSGRNQLAYALNDSLEKWTTPVAIVPKEPSGADSTVRQWDPDCWLNGNTYYGLSGGAPPYLMKSTNLTDWLNLGELMHANMPADLGVSRNEDVSCANMFRLGNKWMLLCISHNLGCRYYLGDFVGEKFLPEFHAMMNWRAWDFFAPESLLTPDGRRVMWAWCNLGYPQSGIQSLPRELSLPADGVLRIKPLRELAQLRAGEHRLSNITLAAGVARRLDDAAGDAVELMIHYEPGTASEFGVEVYCDAAGNNGCPITLKPGSDVLQLGTLTVPLPLNAGEAVDLRVFLDKNVIEVFANERQAAVASHSYAAGNLGIQLICRGGNAVVTELTSWQMQSAYAPVALATSFDTWATFSKGLAGTAAAFDADPDHDALPNGIEFVLGGEPNPANPAAPATAPRPAAARVGNNLVFTYPRRNEAAFLKPLVEFADDLQGAWTTAVDGVNATIVVTPGDPAATVTVSIPQGPNSIGFARLKVTQP